MHWPLKTDLKTNKNSVTVPDPVLNLKFEDISDRSVTVHWDEPEKSNGILKGYTLSYMVKDSPHTKTIKNLTADVSTYKVTELSVSTALSLMVS